MKECNTFRSLICNIFKFSVCLYISALSITIFTNRSLTIYIINVAENKLELRKKQWLQPEADDLHIPLPVTFSHLSFMSTSNSDTCYSSRIQPATCCLCVLNNSLKGRGCITCHDMWWLQLHINIPSLHMRQAPHLLMLCR